MRISRQIGRADRAYLARVLFAWSSCSTEVCWRTPQVRTRLEPGEAWHRHHLRGRHAKLFSAKLIISVPSQVACRGAGFSLPMRPCPPFVVACATWPGRLCHHARAGARARASGARKTGRVCALGLGSKHPGSGTCLQLAPDDQSFSSLLCSCPLGKVVAKPCLDF